MEKKSGYYFGTEIEGKWWRPYMDNGFLSEVMGTTGLAMMEYIFSEN